MARENWLCRALTSARLAMLRALAGGQGVVMNVEFAAPVVICNHGDQHWNNVKITWIEMPERYSDCGILVLTPEEFSKATRRTSASDINPQ